MNFDQHNVNCCYCPIHNEQEFAIDDECHICEQDSEHEYIEIYQNYIYSIESLLRKVELKVGVLAADNINLKQKLLKYITQ